MEVNMNVSEINGVGPKTIKLLNKLNIETIEDVLTYYPYRYNVYSFNKRLDGSENLIVSAIIESSPVVSYIKKNFNRMSFRANVEGITIGVTIFNRAFMKTNLQIGKTVVLIGKFDSKKNILTCSDIRFNIQDGDVEPVYHLTKGISNNAFAKIVASSLKKGNVEDHIPVKYKDEYKFLDKMDAIKKIHFSKTPSDIKNAKIRLIYEELFEFSFKMNYLGHQRKEIIGKEKIIDDEKINTFIASLPFKLTEDQMKAAKDIVDDLKSTKVMNRLLLGDVGSGKTIVSAIGIYASFLGGYQSALMAPTEILALQHYYSLKKSLDGFGLIIDVLTGSMSAKEKKTVYKRAEMGEIDLLVGTHSLLNDNLSFKKLGLVITDEQHRFGVNQRSILQNKTDKPDVLYLSATPIPRTYAMTVYGDLDISMIKTKPSNRKDIITTVKKETEIKDVLHAMLEELKKGHQIYVISPLVEQNEELDLTSVEKLKENLDTAFQNKVNIDIIHGKMKQDKKDAIMNDFKNNQIKVLISTTVIEVGIDVPNASMIVIFNAERFGLATLHQLRGRVGRSDIQSYCYLVSNHENDRLKVMEESNDGFYISQKDFELRGHGDLFGTRQSGDMRFNLANINLDYNILVQAKNDSDEYIMSKAYLESDYYKEISESLDIVD